MLRSFFYSCRALRYRGPLIPPSRLPTASRGIVVRGLSGRRPYQTHTRQHGRRRLSLIYEIYSLRKTSTSASPHPTTLVDPARPSLFYHLLDAPNPLSAHIPAYAVSFLEKLPKDPYSSAVLGWLPAAASSQDDAEAGLGDFIENQNFISMLHEVVKKAIEDGSDERLNAEALQRGEGWMHVNDDRNVPALGRISSPDDIIASVMVEGGKMLPQTYSPMPAYRICTTDGLTTLPEELQSRLLKELIRRETDDGST